MSDAVVDTYRDRARAALHHRGAERGNAAGDGVSLGGVPRLAVVWIRAFFDALRNGPGERDRLMVDQIATRATYARVMGMRVIAGRGFDPVRREGFREALIDRKAAAHYRPLSFVVKTSRQPASIVQEARAAVRGVDARVAVGDIRTMEEIVTTMPPVEIHSDIPPTTEYEPTKLQDPPTGMSMIALASAIVMAP